MVGQQLVEMLRGGMERESVMANQPLGLQLLHVVPDAVAVEVADVSLVYAV